jgi:hypothetical protein
VDSISGQWTVRIDFLNASKTHRNLRACPVKNSVPLRNQRIEVSKCSSADNL